VPELEVGIPAMGESERESIRALAELELKSKLVVWSRMREADLESCRNLRAHLIDISIAVSDLHITRKLKKAKAARLLDMTPRQIAYRIQILKIKVRQI
jgi:homocitrate synthase NifV